MRPDGSTWWPQQSAGALVYGDHALQVWHWRGLAWLRGVQIAAAIGLPGAHINQWYVRYADRFQMPQRSTAVLKLPDLQDPGRGRRRSRLVRVFSMSGAVVLCKTVGSSSALQLGEWLAQRDLDPALPALQAPAGAIVSTSRSDTI